MDIQRLRNLTTGRLHTKMEHIYEDIGKLTGEDGIMTHQLPNAMRALKPWLRQTVVDQRFWDGKYDPSHVGDVDVQPMTESEQREMFERYSKLPSPLAGKRIVVVKSTGE